MRRLVIIFVLFIAMLTEPACSAEPKYILNITRHFHFESLIHLTPGCQILSAEAEEDNGAIIGDAQDWERNTPQGVAKL